MERDLKISSLKLAELINHINKYGGQRKTT